VAVGQWRASRLPGHVVRFTRTKGVPARLPHDRFGSLADIKMDLSDVRFTPKSGHAHRRHQLSANSELVATCPAMQADGALILEDIDLRSPRGHHGIANPRKCQDARCE
jgi:hypothetical protein